MSTMNKVAKELKNVLTESDNKKSKAYDTEAVVTRTEDNILWVKFPGGETETPVRKAVDAKIGDTVLVRVSNHRAWTAGNPSRPPTDDTTAKKAQNVAMTAHAAAIDAWGWADSAHEAADEAWDYAHSAHEAADVAWGHAHDAYNAAYNAGVAADTAQGAAEKAVIDAGTAKTMAEQAISDASDANQAALQAQGAASDAQRDAGNAHTSALEAMRQADEAKTAADEAKTEAATAKENAEQAIESAITANVAASGAVSSLGIVQDVLGTLNWISEHADYELTEDTFVFPSKYYFIRSGTGTDADPYTWSPIVPEDDANPKELGYYQIKSIDEGVSNFVSTHLAVGNDGLYIQTRDGDATSRMLVSPNEGVVIYGQSGEAVATYGTNTIIGNEETVHIEISQGSVDFYDGPSYSRIPNPTGNPNTNNYYEKNDNGEYVLTEDTSVVSDKTYYSKNNPVAYINNQRLYITQSVVTDNMMVGENKWIWKFDSRDDSIILKWIGQGS